MYDFRIDMLTMIFVLVVVNMTASVFFVTYLHLTRPRAALGFFVASKTIQGFSWLLRLVILVGLVPDFTILGDFLMTAGFAVESTIFVQFKGLLSRGMKRFYLVSLVGLGLAVLLLRDATAVRNLFLLAAYLSYMALAAWSMLIPGDTTMFQRVVGICYGTVPLVSVLLHAVRMTELSLPGQPTTVTGIIYYVSVLSMQLVGSVGFLLVASERDDIRLRDLASHDALTGILNRKAFFEQAELLLEKARKDRRSLSAIMLDIDLFKRINDTYGHQVGDQVIRHLCEVVLATIRRTDLFARFGGEEFVVFLPDTGEMEANALALRIHEAVQHPRLKVENGMPAYSVSMGVSSGIPSETDRIDMLLADCDQAMYFCKRNGRNCVAFKPAGGKSDEVQPLCRNDTHQGTE